MTTDWFEWLEEQEPLEDQEPVRVFPDALAVWDDPDGEKPTE